MSKIVKVIMLMAASASMIPTAMGITVKGAVMDNTFDYIIPHSMVNIYNNRGSLSTPAFTTGVDGVFNNTFDGMKYLVILYH